MTSNTIEKKLLEVMEQNGIYISDKWNEELDFDSITFISTIVGIEDIFGIEVPDEMLLLENFKTFNQYVINIKKILLNLNHPK